MLKVYAASVSDPNKLYFGLYHGEQRCTFKGLTGFWVVWDDGEINAPRLIIDNMGEPMGFTPCIRDSTIYGYMRNDYYDKYY